MLEKIIEALGSHPSKKRHRCPVCGSSDGLAVNAVNGARPLIHCHGGSVGDHDAEIIAWLKEHNAWSGGVGRLTLDPIDAYERQRMTEREGEIKAVQARLIWRASLRKPPEAYLNGRGISIIPKNARLLPAGSLPDLPTTNPDKDREPRKWSKFPCAVFPVRNGQGFTGVHVIPLTKDGTQKLKSRLHKSVKRSYGNIKGGYVRLGRADPNRPLIVAEGIETALSAAQLADLPAIATLGSGNMEKLAELPPCREVIIAADNDPPGRKAAELLARQIVGRRTVRIAIPRGEGKDWNDSLQSRQDPKALRRKLLKAKRVKKPKGLYPLTMQEFLALEMPPLTYFLEPFLEVGGTLVLHGQKSKGKSRFSLSMAYAIATGQDLMDFKVGRTGRVLYVDGEMPREKIQRRLAVLGPASENLLILSKSQLQREGARLGKLTEEAVRAEIDRLIAEYKIDVVILDHYSKMIEKDIFDITDWPPIDDWITDHRDNGRSILMIMHEGQVAGKARGFTKILDTFDHVMRIERLKDQDIDKTFYHYKIETVHEREDADVNSGARIVKVSREAPIEWVFVEFAADEKGSGEKLKERVKQMLDEGHWKQKDMATELNVTPARISQVVKELRWEQQQAEELVES